MKDLTMMECLAVTGATDSESGSTRPSGDKDPVPQVIRDNLNNATNNSPTLDVNISAQANNNNGQVNANVSAGATYNSGNWDVNVTGGANSNNTQYGSLNATFHF